jgi:uncharacterized protein (DUF58 family)
MTSFWSRVLGKTGLPSLTNGDSEDLFDDEFQRRIETLALVSRRVFAGSMRAERRTKKTGSGVEFADHRVYQPGDDFRYLDWGVYQRFDKLLVRLFEEEEDLGIAFLLDTSLSMAEGGGEKLRYGKRVLAALSYVGLANLDRVSIAAAGETLVGRMPETRGKARIFRVFRFLRGLQATGKTSLETAIRTFAAQSKRKGMAVLVSDLYDPAGFERGINVLRYNKFDPLVIHLVDQRERNPKLTGDVLLSDCEGTGEREVTVTPGVLKKYAESYDQHLAEIESFCAKKQVSYVRADIEKPFDELVLGVLRRGGFVR